MAGDWIKMRGNLWDDPRIGRICDVTGCREATAIGALYWLWATADQHTEDGCMPGLSMQQIDRKTGVKGFAAALVDVGWLVDDAQGVVIQHFEEHNGASAKKRAQTSKRVASLRSGNSSETPEDEKSNAPGVTHALAREEKRRDVDQTNPIGLVVASPSADAQPDLLAAVAESQNQTEPPEVALPAGIAVPPCPHQEIIALYAALLPTLPQPRVWEGTRETNLRCRWRWVMTEKRKTGERAGTRIAETREEALEWFRKFFKFVADSEFLTGRNGQWTSCDLEWLTKANNFAKVLEGKYHEKKSEAA